MNGTAKYARKRMDVAVGALKPAPWNPRGGITPESVADIAASIAAIGLVQPLVATEDMTLVAGHRRLAAAKLAGLETVPCDVFVGLDEATAKRMTFIENLQRRDADPLLESALVGGLLESGMTRAEISAEAGRGLRWVARRLNLANLSPSWRRRVADGEKIATDCLEHVAAYPADVQERLKGAGWSIDAGDALRWVDVCDEFEAETCDLANAKFSRSRCLTCPNNTGCSPDLFDWEGSATAFGRCLAPKCYKRKAADAVKAAIADAKANGATVKESENHPDYSVDLQSRPDKRHNTLYVWKNYCGEPQMKWGAPPKQGKPDGGMSDGGMSDEKKEERRLKVAAGKARRKLAEWCEGRFAEAFAYRWQFLDVAVARAVQTLFDIGSSWCVFGTTTNATDAALTYLLDVCKCGDAPKGQWARMAAPEIAAKIRRSEIGGIYAERLLAILPEAETALTAEERRLVVSDERLAELREPVRVKWVCEAEDAAMQGDERDGGRDDAETR